LSNSNVSLQATPESIFALKIVPDVSLNEDFYIVLFLTTFLTVKGILDPSVDYFHVLSCKVKLPAFYAVAALYLTLYFLAKKFTLERGKYLLSTWGNPREYEKKLRVNVVGKAAGSLAAIIVNFVIRRDRSFRVFDSIFLSFFIG